MVAESLLVKHHQLLILNRSRKRSPNLGSADRVVAGLCAVVIRPGRLIRSAIVFKPSTLLNLHRALIQRKYRRLFSSNRSTKPGHTLLERNYSPLARFSGRSGHSWSLSFVVSG